MKPFGNITVTYGTCTTGGAVVYATTDSFTVAAKFAKYEARNCLDDPDHDVSPVQQTATLVECEFDPMHWHSVKSAFMHLAACKDINEHINVLKCDAKYGT